MMEPDTSAEAVERLAQEVEDATAHHAWDSPAWVREGHALAAMLRALRAERDATTKEADDIARQVVDLDERLATTEAERDAALAELAHEERMHEATMRECDTWRDMATAAARSLMTAETERDAAHEAGRRAGIEAAAALMDLRADERDAATEIADAEGSELGAFHNAAAATRYRLIAAAIRALLEPAP